MNPLKVAEAVARKVSVVCATCTRYWEGRERGLPDPRCTSTSGCGGPLVGRDYPDYNGPIVDFSRWCFLCGSDSVYGIKLAKSARIFGVCKVHATQLPNMEPTNLATGEAAGRVKSDVVRPGGRIVPILARKPSLLQAIAESEMEFARQDAVAAGLDPDAPQE